MHKCFGDYCTRVTYPLSSVWLRWHRPSFGVKIPGGKMQLKTGSFHLLNMKINSQVKQTAPYDKGTKSSKDERTCEPPVQSPVEVTVCGENNEPTGLGPPSTIINNIILLFCINDSTKNLLLRWRGCITNQVNFLPVACIQFNHQSIISSWSLSF